MPRMIAAVLALFAALPQLGAAEREERTTCSTADFKGRYAFYTQGSNLLTNAQILFAGTLLADGNGRITEWKDWVATPLSPATPPAFKTVELRDIFEQAGRDIRYTVENDCRMTINALVAAPVPGGRTPVVLVGGLAGGGREALLINGAAGAPFLTVSTLRRIDAPERAILDGVRQIGQSLGLGASFP